MKIKRFVAKDMRTALIEIKEELGPDAVIMSNKKIPEGVELMAAVDHSQRSTVTSDSISHDENLSNDVVSISSQAFKPLADSNPNDNPPPADSLSALLNRTVQQPSTANNHGQSQPQAAESNIELQLKSFTDRLEKNAQQNQQARVTTPSNDSTASQSRYLNTQNTQPVNGDSAANNAVNTNTDIEQMRQEMQSIRQLLEHQVSGLMWQDMAQKDPGKAVLVNRLMQMGITEKLSDQVASYIPNSVNEDQAWGHAKKLLSQQLDTTSNDIIHKGGVVALIGPTGVGKTTTIAKLAARFAQIHGADQVVMISTDSYRIAGFEQLSTYGRIIGCQVKMAKDSQSLDLLLQQYAKKKLVLIDTAGMGQRDMRLAQHLATLVTNSRVKIRNYLVLAANSQQRVMQENVQRFKKIPLAGCIFTKLDESLSVGEIITTAIQNGLPIGYLTDGQRVPEDIKVANAEKLVTLAERMTNKYSNQHFSRPMSMTSAAIV
ncbi:flagellar biosynthesis protein FlhF [Thalassotalea profundi]|uniref:Flagellar biosynthesis protein FlhF n=1 Tax=Thalassotalea profundi TaxID=2036687 RepID=A0ABQ3IDZ3_9GAMM|nr:flagellar biosynthesis protein FlhF [Thalassotalea profundi]GHE80796.1 flagellar biosynthesis protein FlhF [Thalassotalea profundi]